MRWAGAAIDPTDPALPDGVEPLAQHVQAPAELARRLAQIGVIMREDAARLAPLLKPGQRLVSPDGDLWRWDGFSVAANAPTGAARRLAGKNRLADIEAELKALREDVEAKRVVATAAEADVTAAADADAAARTHWRERQHAALAARERHAAAEREVGRNAARLSALAEAKARLTANRDETLAAAGEAERLLEELRPTAEVESKLTGVRAEVEEQRARLAELRAEAQALAREAELAQRRLQAIVAERAGWAERRDGAATQITTLEGRVQEAKAERTGPRRRPAGFRAEALGADRRDRARGSGAPDRRRSPRRGRERARGRRSRRPRRAGGDRRRARRGRARRGALRRRPSAGSPTSPTRSARCWKSAPEAVAELAEIKPGSRAARDRRGRGAARPAAARTRAAGRRQPARRGRAATRSRPSTPTLTTERDDLVEAIKRLRQGIQSLNREARERLLASFEVVNNHFKRLFTELFGGGTAELQLVEHEDPLEAGLEIIAKPPGKKPATLSLLSGGEQALTALALIFAVFLTNPAPICVLDEVDAPLDDHNIERFCDLLDEMTRLDRHALHHHHAQSDHHGADEPPLRRHHGGARRLAAGLGRSRRRREAARGGVRRVRRIGRFGILAGITPA